MQYLVILRQLDQMEILQDNIKTGMVVVYFVEGITSEYEDWDKVAQNRAKKTLENIQEQSSKEYLKSKNKGSKHEERID